MTNKDKITVEKVKRSGIFDFKNIYQFAYRWFNDEDYDVEEEKYIENVSGDSKEIEILWKCTKKISDYFAIEMKLKWRVMGLTDVKVEKNGKKVKMNKGAFEIKITGNLVKDRMSKWDRSPLSEFLRDMYDKFIIEGRIRQHENKTFGDLEEFVEQIKAFLTIEGMK